MNASHDVGEDGLSDELRRSVVERLRARGRVFATFEGVTPPEYEALRFPLGPERLHDALAFADLLVGDSQTMAAEAAVLGTPSLRVSSWTGRLAYLSELESRYGLTFAYTKARGGELLAHLDRWLGETSLRANLAPAHARLLSEKVDVATWMIEFLEAGAPLPVYRPR